MAGIALGCHARLGEQKGGARSAPTLELHLAPDRNMNTHQIRQEFLKLARECIAALALPTGDGGTTIGPFAQYRPMLARGTFALHGGLVQSYKSTLDAALSVLRTLPKDMEWSEASVDDLLAESLNDVLFAPPEEQDKMAKQKAQEFAQKLLQPTSYWTVDLPVFGFAGNCAGLSFGIVTLFAGEVDVPESLRLMMPERKGHSRLFARLTIKAIDTNSAVERAIPMLEEHLTVLNALCSDRYPSHVKVATDPEDYLIHRPYKVTHSSEASKPESGIKRSVTRIPLTRAMFEARMEQRGGVQIGRWLASPTPFAKSLLSAYVLAGTACTDDLHQRSFLLFAIALESVVMGKTETTEIGFQLSVHVANLIGYGLEDKVSLRKEVRSLYKTRSAIAHAGSSDISASDVERMREMCLSVLLILTISPAFAAMTDHEQLGTWLAERLLDSSSHHLETEDS